MVKLRFMRHDDFCPCTRFSLQPEFCTCGAAECDEDLAAIVQTFGRRLSEINRGRRSALNEEAGK